MLGVRVALENCSYVNLVKPSQSAFLKLINMFFEAFIFLISAVIDMWISEWSELSACFMAQEQVGRRLALVMLILRAMDEMEVTLFGRSSFMMPRVVSPTQSSSWLPLTSALSSAYKSWLCIQVAQNERVFC